jgi:tRNA threonylcarbamoyladenosine biosynthesis protein TsaE
MILESHSVEETLRIGRQVGELAARQPGTVCIALDGPLGAGKTHLTRGIAQGAGVEDLTLVCSPTFVLLNIYEAGENGRRVYHFDAYRVNGSQEFEELGFEEILRGTGIVVVEWAARVADLLPPDTLSIRMEHAENNHRTLEITGNAALSRQLANALNG